MNVHGANNLAFAAFVEFDLEAGIANGVRRILIDEFSLINGDVPLLEKTFFDLLRRNGTEHPAIASDFGSEFDIDMLKAFSQFFGFGLQLLLTLGLSGVLLGETSLRIGSARGG